MTTPDVNVMLAAFRPDHPDHRVAHAWFADALEKCVGGATLELLPMVAVGFVRVVTGRRAFPVPSAPRQVFAFLRALTNVPGVTLLPLGQEWDAFEKLCLDRGTAGPLISDAWIAAAVIANGLHLVTFDRDFVKLLPASQLTLLPGSPGVREPQPWYEVLRRAA